MEISLAILVRHMRSSQSQTFYKAKEYICQGKECSDHGCREEKHSSERSWYVSRLISFLKRQVDRTAENTEDQNTCNRKLFIIIIHKKYYN